MRVDLATKACGASSVDKQEDCPPPPGDLAAVRLVAPCDVALALGCPLEKGSSNCQCLRAQVTWGHLALGCPRLHLGRALGLNFDWVPSPADVWWHLSESLPL